MLKRPYTANPRTNNVDFRGFDSSIILILRGGILMSIGDFPECLSQAILVGIILVGRFGVHNYSDHISQGRASPLLFAEPLRGVDRGVEIQTAARALYTMLYYTILYYTIL